ncbi:MAG: NAD(P)/FAD-dependent oxidoreductase [bacterium]|nr:NAD(P)/FAD-dependent oxidoreductase [bacterium]
MAHPHLLAPGRIGSLELRNRILMCPMGDNQATDGGYVTDQQIDYFEARARGGAALLLVGSVGVTAPDGLSTPRQSAIGDATFLDGWRRMADRVHAHGAKLALQLVHNGKNAVEDIVAGRPLLVPSLLRKTPETDPLMGMLTPDEIANMGTPAQVQGGRVEFREMTRDDIAGMVSAYAEAVVRAREVGVDACELHAGHGYLIDNFLSPTTNFREDEYGGPVENRARFLVEILEAIRARVGRDYPVWIRINGGEVFVEGETLEDACRVAELAEAAGADAAHVSLYADPARAIGYTEAHATDLPGRFVSLGAAVKKRVGMPIITVGKIAPDEAERILADGQADFVAMGRKLLADPELPNKLAAGAPETVRPCMYHYRCISQIFVRSHVRCAVNAMTGFESTRRLEPAAVAKRVLVVGGGPAGMEAARLASLRGHEVRLVEAADHLGGRFALAAKTAESNAALLEWLEGEMTRREIDLRLGERVEASEIADAGFDEVILATGATWPRPDWGGVDPRVVGIDDLGDWLAEEGEETGRHFVVVGGDRAGLALARVARRRGASVEVIEATEVFASAMGLVGRWRFVHDAREEGVVLHGGARVEGIDADGLRWTAQGGTARVSPADLVLVASGARAGSTLAAALRPLGVVGRMIGDAKELRFVEGAMESAAEVVLSL